MIQIVGPRDRFDSTLPYFINTCSKTVGPNNKHRSWSYQLSPFLLGPVPIAGDDIVSLNVENAWQFAKVYKKHTDLEGFPTTEYWRWAMDGWNTKRGLRYPMGKGAIPEYSLWNGEKLGYIEARKRIYIPSYQNAVIHTQAFKNLIDIYQTYGKIILWDVDGYNRKNKSFLEVIEDPTKIMGHAFVLGFLLKGLTNV